MNKTVLVTGAGGYIGRHVVTALLDMSVEVWAVDYNTDQVDSRARKVKFDIFADSKNIYEELGSPDVCLHMAWQDGFIHNADSHILNISYHYQFIRNMVNGGLKHVAIMGTMHEIGYWEGEIDENTPTNPYSLYGIAKNSLRQALSIFLKDKDITFQWLRAFYIYGDDAKNNSIFSKIIKMEQEGKKTFPFTTGKNKYDFITVGELAKQIALSVAQSEITGIINCCSGKSVSLRDMVNDFLEKNNYRIRLEYGVYPERPYDSPASWGNNEKILKIMKNIVKKGK